MARKLAKSKVKKADNRRFLQQNLGGKGNISGLSVSPQYETLGTRNGKPMSPGSRPLPPTWDTPVVTRAPKMRKAMEDYYSGGY